MRVPGIGVLPARVLLCGEAPGFIEAEKTGRPFTGKSGKELDGHLERIGVPRSTIRLTNICKEQPPVVRGKQSAPTAEMIERDVPELLEELAAARPLWIGAVGRVAARWLAGISDMESTHGMAYPLRPEVAELLHAERIGAARVERALTGAPGIHLRRATVHPEGGPMTEHWTVGGPHDPTVLDDAWIAKCRVVPLYHPAAGLHNPEIQPLVWHDLRTFGAYVNGRLHPQTPFDAYPHPRYVQGVRGWPKRVDVVAVDTEGSRARPWSVQLAHTPGAASVVRYASLSTQRKAVRRILQSAHRVIYQNALHDQDVIEALGLPFDWSRIEDIYVMADVLRLVPRGLKAGARRDCGMEMRAYTDVVAPAEKRLAREYVDAAIQARECFECVGTGSIVDAEKMAKRVERALTRNTPLLQPKSIPTVKCPHCVDGGLWEPRAPELRYDEAKAVYEVKSGWEVQRYLRSLKKDIEAGKYDAAAADASDDADAEAEEGDSPRRRVGNWPDEVREQITAALGCEMPAPTLDDVPLDDAVSYAARDADATLRRYPILKRQVEELGLWDAYRLDVDVLPVAAEIQRNGMRINRQHFADLVEELRARKATVADELESHIGRRLNPGSPDQVAELMFGKMDLDYTEDDDRELGSAISFDLVPEKWTPSRKRGSVDEKTLEGMKLKYAVRDDLVQFINYVLTWKMCDKIQQFAEKIPRLADASDRVHTRIKIGPATFRWASAEPNLQQIPSREKHGEELGKRVRDGFEVVEGRIFGNRDFDQVEMRVLAWYAQDEALMRAFQDGTDIHTLTASKVFRVPFEAVTKAQRTSAKNIGFGIVYGVTPTGLKAQMDLRGQHWTLEECRALIDSYLYEAYPGVGRFMMEAHAEARRFNMVRSLVGHIRYTPAVHSSIKSISEEALRQAANFKIQCTAAELMKMAERDLYRDCGMRFHELGAMILMSEHDALAVEAPDDPDAVEEVDALMSAYMTNPYPLEGVEITSGSKWAKTWGGTK